jgi:hypothetical protein
MTDNRCPVCEEGSLTEVVSTHEIFHKGRCGVVESLGAVCGFCEVYQAGGDHLRENKNRMLRFKASVDFGHKADDMPIDLLRAIYDRGLHFYGTPIHFWSMKLSRTRGTCRLPRGLWRQQFEIGWKKSPGM